MAQWFEDETFWKVLFPFIFPEERMDQAGGEVASILALVGTEVG
jgi:hypothetical protein